MRVLHVITGLAAGGAEQQLRLLLRHQDPATEVAVLTNPGSVATAIRSAGTVVHDIGMRGNRDLAALPRLVRVIRDGRFDVVHTHLYRACLYGRLAARLAGVRSVVATEHSLGDDHIEGRRISPGVRGLYLAGERLGRATIAVSAPVARRLAAWGVPAARIVEIPNGIEAAAYRFDPARRSALRSRLGIAPDAYVVGSVGRLVPEKRMDLMLRAVAGRPGVTALVVGEGPERASLTALAAELGVPAVFTGESPDVPGLLSVLDLFVSASAAETFGLAVLEALAAGLPVLYADCPALDDMPGESVPGAVRIPVEPDEAHRAIAGAVRAQPGRRTAPPILARFDMADIAARVEDVYRWVTGSVISPSPVLNNEEP
jgi:glycosyltransferase involved in cell wall biosynthesis